MFNQTNQKMEKLKSRIRSTIPISESVFWEGIGTRITNTHPRFQVNVSKHRGPAKQPEAIEAIEAIQTIEAIEAIEGIEAIQTIETIEAIEAIETIEAIECSKKLFGVSCWGHFDTCFYINHKDRPQKTWYVL